MISHPGVQRTAPAHDSRPYLCDGRKAFPGSYGNPRIGHAHSDD